MGGHDTCSVSGFCGSVIVNQPTRECVLPVFCVLLHHGVIDETGQTSVAKEMGIIYFSHIGEGKRKNERE